MRGAGNLKTPMDILIAVSNFMKRIFDLVLSLFGLLIFFLPMIFIALLIKRRLGHKVIFTQPRPGIGGEVFNIIKFIHFVPGPSTILSSKKNPKDNIRPV
jgi:lipopolysaccharide/colanic/teichoic acid biosynthesis glycosyltransferase